MKALSRWTMLIVGVGLGVGLGMAVQDWRQASGRASVLPEPMVAKLPGTPPPAAPNADPRDIVKDLRSGGFILFFRHTTRTKLEAVSAFDILELTRPPGTAPIYPEAVCLNGTGRAEARLIGELFAQAQIPVGQVISSPICRAEETARLAFGRVDQTDHGLVYDRMQNPDNQDDFREGLEDLLRTAPVDAGRNTIIVGHGDTLPKNPALFASGVELATRAKRLEEGGFYVMRRDTSGALHLVHKFIAINDLARYAVTLRVP